MQHMEKNCRVVDATHGRKQQSCGCNTWKKTERKEANFRQHTVNGLRLSESVM